MEVKKTSRHVLSELHCLTNNENVRNSNKEFISPHTWRSLSKRENYTESTTLIFGQTKSSHLTNLELLTKVASRMQYDTNQKVIECGDENLNLNGNLSRELNETSKPRKEKSLSILCDKFIRLYPLNLRPGNSMEISLDEATQFIGTDRRRIYDILIVLECLQMASKVCKNHYQWHGTQHLEGTLSQLKWLALRLGFFQNIDISMSDDSSVINEDCTKDCDTSDLNVLDPVQINVQTQKALSNEVSASLPSVSLPAAKTEEMQDQKLDEDSDLDHNDSSLGIMCQKFLMLFLLKSKVITLDNAAKILLGASGAVKDCHKIKTKIRRLYDIANVLSSLELIKKINVSTGSALPTGPFIRLNKKPAFQYIGPEVEPKPLPDHALVTLHTTRHSLLGHPLHAACEKKCTRKRKARHPCLLQPKLQHLDSGSSSQGEPAKTSFIHGRSLSPPSSSGTGAIREKFPRSHSENCIREDPKCHSSLRSDILQVAELELQRIFNEEQQKEKENSSVLKLNSSPVRKNISSSPKANWRHHHSENCISLGPSINSAIYSSDLKSLKDISWKNSILRNTNARVNAKEGANSLLKNSNGMMVITPQKSNDVRNDMSICVLNRSNSVGKITDGKFTPFGNKSAVPVVIHSVQKSSHVRGISVNPVPISVSNCIMGPAYIIRQCPSGSGSNINPVSISLNKVDDVVYSRKNYSA